MAKNDFPKHKSERTHSLNGANEKPVDQIRDTVNDSLLQNNNMSSQEIIEHEIQDIEKQLIDVASEMKNAETTSEYSALQLQELSLKTAKDILSQTDAKEIDDIPLTERILPEGAVLPNKTRQFIHMLFSYNIIDKADAINQFPKFWSDLLEYISVSRDLKPGRKIIRKNESKKQYLMHEKIIDKGLSENDKITHRVADRVADIIKHRVNKRGFSKEELKEIKNSAKNEVKDELKKEQEIRSIARSAMGLISRGDLHLVTNGEVGYVLEKPYDFNKSSMYKLVLFWGYDENGQHNKNYVIDCEEEYIYDIEANFSEITQFSSNYQDIAEGIRNLLKALKEHKNEFKMSRYDPDSIDDSLMEETTLKVKRYHN